MTRLYVKRSENNEINQALQLLCQALVGRLIVHTFLLSSMENIMKLNLYLVLSEFSRIVNPIFPGPN